MESDEARVLSTVCAPAGANPARHALRGMEHPGWALHGGQGEHLSDFWPTCTHLLRVLDSGGMISAPCKPSGVDLGHVSVRVIYLLRCTLCGLLVANPDHPGHLELQ